MAYKLVQRHQQQRLQQQLLSAVADGTTQVCIYTAPPVCALMFTAYSCSAVIEYHTSCAYILLYTLHTTVQ
jgi:hypothetical protein